MHIRKMLRTLLSSGPLPDVDFAARLLQTKIPVRNLIQNWSRKTSEWMSATVKLN